MTVKTRILGALAAASLALAGLGAAPATADPGHTVSITTVEHGTFTVSDAADFCTGEPIVPTITGNSLFHVTYFPAGDEVWGTFTVEGTASFLQPSTGLTFSGRITVWGNFNVNERNQNDTFTATFTLTAVDSSGVTHTESGHVVAHVAFNAVDPTSPIVSFNKFNATCS
ncbi:UNVERIFIED_ORG: hypothetical protein ABIB52_004505 [Arthrobacter sp. UYCu721]